MNKSNYVPRHSRESGKPDLFEFPGFRLLLAIASSAGMTLNEVTSLGNTTLAGVKGAFVQGLF